MRRRSERERPWGRPLVIVALAVAGFIGAGGIAALALGPTIVWPHAVLPTDCVHAREHPRKVVLACGDGGFFVKDIRWRDWGAERTLGHGTAEVNDCEPSCAAGSLRSHPGATVTASHVRTCPTGTHQYTVLTYSFPGEAPLPPSARDATATTVPFPCVRPARRR